LDSNDTFLVADCHLEGSRPRVSELFIQFLNDIKGAGQLWILGDFVEYWLGDDAGNPELNSVFEALSALVHAGTSVNFMHGNRDFLLGDEFGKQFNTTVHRSDELCIRLPNNETVLLLHGDTLCTDDVEYQKLRQMVRSDEWQQPFLNQSISERKATAQSLRDISRDATAGKSQTIMDVNPHAVAEAFSRTGVNTMIHGHTHRPNTHQPLSHAEDYVRMVLGDWHDDHAMVAHANSHGLSLRRFPFG